MKCFARWKFDNTNDLYFRDQTILQYGDSWKLRANFVLLNPGSAKPLDGQQYNDYLEEQNLPYFVRPKVDESYHRFSIDRLMRDVLTLYSTVYSGGAIKIYNLFNLKNQHSSKAIEQFNDNISHIDMFSSEAEIIYCDAPVVIASGGNARHEPLLKKELIKYIRIDKTQQLYGLLKASNNLYSIKKVTSDDNSLFNTYHPSYTFKYGNKTVFENPKKT